VWGTFKGNSLCQDFFIFLLFFEKKMILDIDSEYFLSPQTSSNFLFIAVLTKPGFRGFYGCFGSETKTGVVRILVIFQDRPMFSHIIQKVFARASH